MDFWNMMAAAAAVTGATCPAPKAITIEDLPPEVRERISKDGQLLGPPVSSGTVLWAEPTPSRMISAVTDAPLKAGAIIHEEAVTMAERRSISESVIRIGAPFDVVLQPESVFSHVRRKGRELACRVLPSGEAFTPAEDEKGAIYPGVCLADSDGDGRHETAWLLPYRPDQSDDRSLPITPVALHPLPAGNDWRTPAFDIHRRIRVAAITGASVTFMVEEEALHRQLKEVKPWRAEEPARMSLLLEPGQEAEFAGVRLFVEPSGRSWAARASGRFSPWIRMDLEGCAFHGATFWIAPKGA